MNAQHRSLLVTPGGKDSTVETLRGGCGFPDLTSVPMDVFCRSGAYRDNGTLSIPDLVRLFIRACEAVHLAHQGGMLHGSLQASDVLVDASGQPRISQIGVIAFRRGNLRNDLVELGTLFFDILRERKTSTDDRLIAIVNKAMIKDADRGYASADEIAKDLRDFVTPTAEPIDEIRNGCARWLNKHVKSPRNLIACGSIVGIVVGTFLAIPATQAITNATISGHSGGIWETVFNYARGSGWWMTIWMAAAVTLPFAIGPIALRMVKPNTHQAAMAMGTSAGLLAGVVAWICGAGGFVNTVATLNATRDAQILVASAAVPSNVAATNSPPRQVRVRSTIADTSEEALRQAIYARIVSDVRAASFAAGWLGTLLPLFFGVGFGTFGAVATITLDRQGQFVPIK